MGHHHDTRAEFAAEGFDEAEDFVPSARVEARHGFVQHEIFRAHRENARKRRAALFTAGELEGGFLRELIGIEPDKPERFGHARCDFVFR